MSCSDWFSESHSFLWTPPCTCFLAEILKHEIHACIHTHVHTHMHIHLYTHTHMHTYITYTYAIYMHIHLYTHTHMYVHNTLSYTHINIRIYKYTRTDTQTQTHILIFLKFGIYDSHTPPLSRVMFKAAYTNSCSCKQLRQHWATTGKIITWLLWLNTPGKIVFCSNWSN